MWSIFLCPKFLFFLTHSNSFVPPTNLWNIEHSFLAVFYLGYLSGFCHNIALAMLLEWFAHHPNGDFLASRCNILVSNDETFVWWVEQINRHVPQMHGLLHIHDCLTFSCNRNTGRKSSNKKWLHCKRDGIEKSLTIYFLFTMY